VGRGSRTAGQTPTDTGTLRMGSSRLSAGAWSNEYMQRSGRAQRSGDRHRLLGAETKTYLANDLTVHARHR